MKLPRFAFNYSGMTVWLYNDCVKLRCHGAVLPATQIENSSGLFFFSEETTASQH